MPKTASSTTCWTCSRPIRCGGDRGRAFGHRQGRWGTTDQGAAAELLGGGLYARRHGVPARRHLLLCATLFTAAWLPLLVPLPAWAVLALAPLPGALFVPLLTVAGLTVTALAPPGCSTEAVGWMSGVIRLGLATGTALAAGLGGPFALVMLAAALCTLLLTARPAPAAA
ncbi:hypothetical protein ABT269_35895 [Streptomyces viridosporus]|uniref:hypothetical protein n=1 Tax=Streptomyces viridosporus TaxID=67581 RepID=UPI00332D6682